MYVYIKGTRRGAVTEIPFRFHSPLIYLQRDALRAAGVEARHLYEDTTSGKRDDRPGLAACLKALRESDTLVVWKLDRLSQDLRHLVNTVHDLTARGIGFKVLTGHGATIDTTSPSGKLVFSIFAALAEFERELIIERTRAGMAAARARGRSAGRSYKMTAAKLRLTMAAMGQPETKVGALCAGLGITRQALYRLVDPNGKIYGRTGRSSSSARSPPLNTYERNVLMDNLLMVVFEALYRARHNASNAQSPIMQSRGRRNAATAVLVSPYRPAS